MILVFLGSLALAVTLLAVLPAEGRPGGSAPGTWPTRTPTAPGAPPDTPAPATQPPGGGSTTPPAGTAPAGATSLPGSGGGSLASTPVGGYLATAEPCGVPPTVRALGAVNVRSGPATSFEIVATLVYLEVRPILGRSAAGPWWFIGLLDGSGGWVSDQAVVVNGNTSPIPVVKADGTMGEEPSPTATWEPTRDLDCPTLPTYTPTATAAMSASPTRTPSTTPASNTATITPSPRSTALSSVTPSALPPVPTVTPVPAPEPADDPVSQGTNLILYAGLGLVLIGAASLVVRQRR